MFKNQSKIRYSGCDSICCCKPLVSKYPMVTKLYKETGQGTKTDKFSEKFQMAFDIPPALFSENYIAFLFRKRPKKGPNSAI